MTRLLDTFPSNDTGLPGESYTDAERYEWIRGHRGDPVIEMALLNSNLDRDFDRRIDAAIEISRRGARQSIASLGPVRALPLPTP